MGMHEPQNAHESTGNPENAPLTQAPAARKTTTGASRMVLNQMASL